MKQKICFLLVLVALLVFGISSAQAGIDTPLVQIIELFDGEAGGSYEISNNSPYDIAAFFVSNDTAVDAWTPRDSWGAVLVDEEMWDDNPYGWPLFDQLFPEASLIVGYYSYSLNDHGDEELDTGGIHIVDPNYIKPGDVDGDFFWLAAGPESDCVAISSSYEAIPCVTITETPGHDNPVPEPGTMILLGSGLAGLGLYRRRINKNK